MYPNLDAEMARKGIKRKDLAQLFKGRVPTVSEKLNGKYPLLLDEAVRIRKRFSLSIHLSIYLKLVITKLLKEENKEMAITYGVGEAS